MSTENLNEQERVENLLNPRYEVIADYPGNELNVGTILWKLNDECWTDGKQYEFVQEVNFFDKYHHLFRKLHWWEHREEKDMPQYVKRLDDNSIIKIDRWFLVGSDMRWHTENPFITMSADTCIPVTEKEYTQYINQSKK